jgi:hypothetical protein
MESGGVFLRREETAGRRVGDRFLTTRRALGWQHRVLRQKFPQGVLRPPRIALCFHPMFDLTRREQAVVAGFLFLLVLGFGVKHWRETRGLQQPPAEVLQTD